jgi:2-dehydropantoate 2-reductase
MGPTATRVGGGIMKILVYGTGVIGTTYGYVLAQAGHDVTHYVRSGQDPSHGYGIPIRLLDGRTAEPHELEAIYPARIVDGYGPNDGHELIIVSLKHYEVPSIL